MTDILIPLGKGSRHQDFELRMCLRSIEKHLKGVGNIFLVGEKPDYIQNVIHIPAKDNPNNWNRARNIYDKIMAGINWEHTFQNQYSEIDTVLRLSDNFLFMNDDHYLLTDYEAGEFPYYHRGLLNTYNFQLNPPQLQQVLNTINKTDFKAILDYDVHCPILYNKEKFRAAFDGLKWSGHGFCIKSIYCAANKIENPVECEDLKFSEAVMKDTIYRVLEDREWFSIGDRCLKTSAMKEVLQELYPNKSKYEMD